jgi:pyrroloquinoline quinone biosynthesis protein D
MTDIASLEDRLPDGAVPRLPRGVRPRFDAVRRMHMLLAPERAVRLDPIAAAIIAETDGVRDFAAIVAALAAKYNAPAAEIAGDARKLLVDLMDKRMLEVVR